MAMDNAEYNPTGNQETEGGSQGRGDEEDSRTSLEGRGWDILVGGEQNAARMGGDDPFDAHDPDEVEVDDILGITARPAAGTAAAGDEDEEISPRLEAPPLPFDELMTPPGEQPADVPSGPGPFEMPPGYVPFVLNVDEVPFGEGEAPAPLTGAQPGWEETGWPEPMVPPQAGMPEAYSLRPYIHPHDPFIQPVVSKPEGPDLEINQDLQAVLVTQERIDALWAEIDETYDIVIRDVRGYFSATEQALADLKKAREYLLAGHEYYDNAEEIVKRVRAQIRLEEKVRQWSRTRGVWLGVYLVIWLLLLATASLTTNRIDLVAQQFVPDWMAATYLPGLYGGLGGVVGALYVLIKHIAKKRDFDPIHTPWYITNPFLGIALGVITYLLLRASAGLLGISVLPEGELATPGLYAFCVIVGFNQNVLWSLVDRLVKAVLPSDDTKGAVEKPSEE